MVEKAEGASDAPCQAQIKIHGVLFTCQMPFPDHTTMHQMMNTAEGWILRWAIETPEPSR